MIQNYHTQKDYFVFFLKMKRHCVNRRAENDSRREGRMTSRHINAEWRLDECARIGGNSNALAEKKAKWKQMWGQAAKSFKAPQWQNLKQPPISKPT